MTKATKRQKNVNHQYLFFRIFNNVGGFAFWAYFEILLLKEANNQLTLLFAYNLIYFVFVFIGFLVQAHILGKWGYLRSFRFAFTLEMLAVAILALGIEHVYYIFPVVAIVHGYARGIYWNVTNVFTQRDLSAGKRSKFFSLLSSNSYLLQVIVPVLAGGFIQAQGYFWLFVLAIMFYLALALAPWKINKHPRDVFDWKELHNIQNRKAFSHWRWVIITEQFFYVNRMLAFMALPFLFIGDELGVGALYSVVGLAAAIVAFTRRKDNLKKKERYGYVGAGIVSGLTLLFGIIWNLPMLIIRNVLSKLGFALWTPVKKDISFRDSGMMLGHFLSNTTVELQVLRIFLMTVVRVILISLYLLLFFLTEIDHLAFLRIIVIVTSVQEIFTLFLYEKLGREIKLGT